jgi:hypothetical protein
MSGRAKLQHVGQDGSGTIQPLTSVVLHQPGTSTPFAGAVYANPAGGAPLSSLMTDDEGLIEVYCAPNDARRVDVVLGGDISPLRSQFDPDVEALFFDGRTAASSLAGGLGVTSNGTASTLTLQNAHSNEATLRVLDAAGAETARWDQYGLQMKRDDQASRLEIGDYSTLFGDPWTTRNFLMGLYRVVPPGEVGAGSIFAITEHKNSNNDDSMVSLISRQMLEGNTRLTTLDMNVDRTVGMGNKLTTALEIFLNSTVAPVDGALGPHYGMIVAQNVDGAISGSGPFVPQSAAIRIYGKSGWLHYIHCYGNGPADNGLKFHVVGYTTGNDVAGDVVSAGRLYTTGMVTDRVGILDHSAAPINQTWTGLDYSSTQGAWRLGTRSNGGGGYLPGLLNPNGGRVGIGVALSASLTAALTVSGGIAYSGNQIATGVISPAAFTGNVDNWNPAGLDTARIARVSSSAGSRDLTGIQAQPAGTMLTLVNIGGGGTTIVCKNSSGSSSAGNRFAMAADVSLGAGQSATFWYDGASSAWRPLDR